MPVPVPVPVPLVISCPGSIHTSRQNSDSEEEEGSAIYTSRPSSGVVLSNPRSMSVANHLPPPALSQTNPPHSNSHSNHHSHSHSPRFPYPGTNKPKTGSHTSLRHRIFAAASGASVKRGEGRERRTDDDFGTSTEGEGESDKDSGGKVICTTPGMVCAGETETETDEPVCA